MRPAVEDMTVQHWMEARALMNKSAFRRLVRIARAGGIQLPAGILPAHNPRITFDGSTDAISFAGRVSDVDALNKFNEGVRAWAAKVERELRASAQSSFSHRSETSEKFPALAAGIKANIRKDRKYKLETRSIGFSIPRHGVYLQRGAGRGYGGFIGSRWLDKYGQLKSTDDASKGLMDTGNRPAVNWFNHVITRNMEELVAIVADYSMQITVNLNTLLIE